MLRPRIFGLSCAAPIALLCGPAMADLSAAQVWDDWKQYLEGTGYTVEATETARGDDVVVSDVTLSMATPEQDGSFSVTLGELSFVQNGGDVDVMMPGSMPMTITGTGDAGKPFTAQVLYGQTGQKMTASGDPDAISYDYTADSVSVTLDKLTVDGAEVGPDTAKVVIGGTGVTSKTTMTIGEMRDYAQTGAIEELTYDVNLLDMETQGTVAFTGGIKGVSFDGTGTIPLESQGSDAAAMMNAGFAIDGSFDYESGATDMTVTDPEDGTFVSQSSSQGGNLSVRMGKDALGYAGEQRDVKVNMQVPQMPFPIDLQMARMGFNLLMPVSAQEAPQDFEFGLALADFTMSDMLWSLFDPAAQLPRDPATIDIALTGEAIVKADIMDPEAAATSEAPAEVSALSIDKFLVDAVGTRLEGTGDVTFDNGDMVSYGGIPKPVGEVNVSLAGANALLDKLVAMGILPEQQAMGARMMMGMCAVPGQGEDTLTSKIEFNDQGQVLANGQRIK